MTPTTAGDGWISLPWATLSIHRSPLAGVAMATVLLCAVAMAGCGFGPGPPSSGTATLTVTRDYGSKTMVSAARDDPPSSETVIRLLDDEADVETRYGGGFVQSIDGLAGTVQKDWFFYVNGVESPVGAADVHVRGGDRIWWDYRDWRGAMSVPAVVGSWPEPFAQASAETPKPVGVDCVSAHAACETVKARLDAVSSSVTDSDPDAMGLRVLVGTWPKVRSDPTVNGLQGASDTGVFAIFKGPTRDGWHLVGLDATNTPAHDFGPRAGLVAALGRPPTWIVTGSSNAAVLGAAKLLEASSLRDHYAIAAVRGHAVPLPVPGAE
jgi:uncharacterized protein DUF4430